MIITLYFGKVLADVLTAGKNTLGYDVSKLPLLFTEKEGYTETVHYKGGLVVRKHENPFWPDSTYYQLGLSVEWLWPEDDATAGTSGHESVIQAYKRLFGKDLTKEDVAFTLDRGDNEMRWLKDDTVVVVSYLGNNAIYRVQEQKPPVE
jgi:hypothetical protein